MNTSKPMSGNSALTLEVLAAIVLFGLLTLIFVPQIAPTVIPMIVTALVGIAQNLCGVKAGATLPQQAGSPQPGQSSQTETTSRVSTVSPDPAAPLEPPQPGVEDAPR